MRQFSRTNPNPRFNAKPRRGSAQPKPFKTCHGKPVKPRRTERETPPETPLERAPGEAIPRRIRRFLQPAVQQSGETYLKQRERELARHDPRGKGKHAKGGVVPLQKFIDATFETRRKVDLPPEAPIAAEGAFKLLIQPLQRAIAEQGYTAPTSIQQAAIEPALQRRDILACAQTGTGKTAAFSLPILQHLAEHPDKPVPRRPRALILAPTRELAAQIDANIQAYNRHLRLSHLVVFGGVNINPQIAALGRGVDILTATPGRLLDLAGQQALALDGVESFVLDEADRMLDMGFAPDVRRIIDLLPDKRHSLFFSATFPPPVTALAKELFRQDPLEIRIKPEAPAVERIRQSVRFVLPEHKPDLLKSYFQGPLRKVLIFTKMRHTADKVARALQSANIPAEAIHADKSQAARTRALAWFKKGKIAALIATDIASRGIDVEQIDLVINYDVPNEPESYVHRIGRTARAGADGQAVTFCAPRDRHFLAQIEKFLRQPIPVDRDHPWHSSDAQFATGAEARPLPKGRFRPSGAKGSKHTPRKHKK